MNSPINILLVDDEVRNLEVLESILSAPDYRLVRAQRAEEALMALLDGEFAAMVLDIQMPGMSGIELANLVKQRRRTQHIPIIFLTAYFNDDKDILHGYEVGAVDYLAKPINPQILKSKIAVFVELFRKTRALSESNRALELEIMERRRAEEALRLANDQLEARVRDRTLELSRANVELLASESKYRGLVEMLPAAVYTCDGEGNVLLHNDAAVSLWGGPPLPGKSFWCGSHSLRNADGAALPPSAYPAAITALQGNAVKGVELIVERPDGSRRNVLTHTASILDSAGTLTGVVNMLIDITEQKRVEEALRESEARLSAAVRAKDEFLAALSHELRTPLSPVLLLSSEGADNPELSDSVRADFATIRKNIELEARLIDDLLDLTRIDRGKLGLNLQPRDVHPILRDAFSNVKLELEEKRIELKVDFSQENCVVLGDDVRLQQAFWNVLKNAVKFTPSDGQIVVQTRIVPKSGCVSVRIIDSGIGMTAEELGRVFDAFSQGDHAESRSTHRFGGIGLGLTITRKLVELQQGSISAYSAGRGRGAEFAIHLPLVESNISTNPPRGIPASHAGSGSSQDGALHDRKRILLVEDHEPTRSTLALLLRHRHFDVATAGSVAEARSLAEKTEFDILISDVGLPDGSGYDLMAMLRQRAGLKGIALTGYGMEQDIARSLEAGFVAHLTKPVRVQSLESALASAIASANGDPIVNS